MEYSWQQLDAFINLEYDFDMLLSLTYCASS